ncbi:MAG: hypothetical protein AAFV53_18755 [Myxococcota bacterium]
MSVLFLLLCSLSAWSADLSTAIQGRWYLYFDPATEERLAVMQAVLVTPPPTMTALDAKFGATEHADFARQALSLATADPDAPRVKQMQQFLNRANDSWLELGEQTLTIHFRNLTTGELDHQHRPYRTLEDSETHLVIQIVHDESTVETLTLSVEGPNLRLADVGVLKRVSR